MMKKDIITEVTAVNKLFVFNNFQKWIWKQRFFQLLLSGGLQFLFWFNKIFLYDYMYLYNRRLKVIFFCTICKKKIILLIDILS